MTKVHIGCGGNYIPDWVNIDLFEGLTADTYADIAALPFKPESIDCLYCSHVLEHVHRRAILATLSHWHVLLKPRGTLRLAVPDFAACVAWYNRTGDLKSLIGLLYGRQDNYKNVHHIIFDEGTLSDGLRRAGFVDIRRWDWRKTEHAAFDDFSQSYLPHLDKEHGQLMSLNLEASKP